MMTSQNKKLEDEVIPSWLTRDRPPTEAEFVGAFIGGGPRADASELRRLEASAPTRRKGLSAWAEKQLKDAEEGAESLDEESAKALRELIWGE